MLAKIGARRWIAGIMVVGDRVHCTMFATSPETSAMLRMLGGHCRGWLPAGDLVYLTGGFRLSPRPCQRAVYDCHAGNHDARLYSFRLHPQGWTACGTERLAVAVPAGRAAVGVLGVAPFYLNDTRISQLAG